MIHIWLSFDIFCTPRRCHSCTFVDLCTGTLHILFFTNSFCCWCSNPRLHWCVQIVQIVALYTVGLSAHFASCCNHVVLKKILFYALFPRCTLFDKFPFLSAIGFDTRIICCADLILNPACAPLYGSRSDTSASKMQFASIRRTLWKVGSNTKAMHLCTCEQSYRWTMHPVPHEAGSCRCLPRLWPRGLIPCPFVTTFVFKPFSSPLSWVLIKFCRLRHNSAGSTWKGH